VGVGKERQDDQVQWVSNDDVGFTRLAPNHFAAQRCQPNATLPNQTSTETALNQVNTFGEMSHVLAKTVGDSMGVAPGHNGNAHEPTILPLMCKQPNMNFRLGSSVKESLEPSRPGNP
jgi:hypothetical protein